MSSYKHIHALYLLTPALIQNFELLIQCFIKVLTEKLDVFLQYFFPSPFIASIQPYNFEF